MTPLQKVKEAITHHKAAVRTMDEALAYYAGHQARTIGVVKGAKVTLATGGDGTPGFVNGWYATVLHDEPTVFYTVGAARTDGQPSNSRGAIDHYSAEGFTLGWPEGFGS